MGTTPGADVGSIIISATTAFFTDLARCMAEAAKAIAESLASMGRAATKAHAAILRYNRIAHGGMSDDAVRWPDQWQSMVCAGLLCSIVECPSDRYGLACTHSCHD